MTVFLELIASLQILVRRVTIQDAGSGVFVPRHFMLVGLVLLSAVLLEMLNRKLTKHLLFLGFISSLVFFSSSFFLPPKGHSYELAIILAYVSLLILVSMSLVIAFSRTPDPGKTFATFMGVAILALIAGFINTFHYTQFHGTRDADVAVVLGSSVRGPHEPSRQLKARLDAAAELYRKGEVKRIAVTGGTRRFNTYESKIGAEYLRSIGIPDSVIITEDKTENTVEQVLYVKRYLIEKLKMKNVVIVSDSWHLPRALLMCSWTGIKAEGYASRYRVPRRLILFWRFRESAGLQAYMLFGA